MGWYAVVRMRLIPSSCESRLNSFDSNCEPLSVVIKAGTPNSATHLLMKALATVSVSILGIGIASGQRVNLSMIVRIYLQSPDNGKGPTISMWMWLKRESNLAKVDLKKDLNTKYTQFVHYNTFISLVRIVSASLLFCRNELCERLFCFLENLGAVVVVSLL